MARLFVYDGRQFPDPDPQVSVDEVRRQLSVFFPELTNADVREERRGEDTLYTFSKRIGTKGRSSAASDPGPRQPTASPLSSGSPSLASALATRHSLLATSPAPLPSGRATRFSLLATLPDARLRVFELAEALIDAEGELDVEAAGLLQPDIALAFAEADAYVHATRQAVQALRRLM